MSLHNLSSSSPTQGQPEPPPEERVDPPSRKRSKVWDHFEKKNIRGLVKAICNYCHNELAGGSNSGTSHLQKHLGRCKAYLSQRVSTTPRMVETSIVDPSTLFDPEEARRELALMIIMHEYPLSIVDHTHFRRYSSALQPLFKPVSRNTIRSDVMKFYQEEKENQKAFIERNQGRIAITSDMWTSSNQRKGYMVITGHFVDDLWNLQSRILGFMYVPCPHTKENLCDVLFKCLIEWNVDRRLSTITLDNASTNDAMIGVLLQKLDTSSLLLSGSLIQMRCCAHILNLIVKDGLDVIRDSIEKVRDSVSFWTATPKREETFEVACQNVRIDYSKKLVLDCPTRWNSTFLMLQTAFEYQDAFSRAKLFEPLYKTLPSQEEWDLAKDICGKLKKFHEVTEAFSGTKYPTANLYFPMICDIRFAIMQWLSSPNPIIQDMASKMQLKLEKYWSEIHGIMGVATVLDPRYKLKLINFHYRRIFGEQEASHEVGKIEKLCHELLSEYKVRSDSRGMVGESSRDPINVVDDDCDDSMMQYDIYIANETISYSNKQKSELDYYLDEAVLPRGQPFDILLWWKMNGVKYPVLQSIAKDILAIPVSTVASESAFSTSGRLLSAHRSRLTPDILEALMCCQSWIRGNINNEEVATIHDDEDEDQDTLLP